MRGNTSLLRGWRSGAVYIQLKRSECNRQNERKRSERSLPQRPCVVGQQVWPAKTSQTAQRARPPCACHMGEQVPSFAALET